MDFMSSFLLSSSLLQGIFIFFIGLCVGSFLNVLIYRIPLKKSVVSPASFCTNCKKPIKFYQNIPVFAYIFLGGKSACCGTKISAIYPVVELLGGLLFLLAFLKLGFNTDAFLLGTVFSLMLALSIIDIKFLVAYDSINLSALSLAILYQLNILENIQAVLIAGGAMTFLRFYLSFLLKKEAMGEGDIIVVGTMAAILGVKLAFISIFLSALLAIFGMIFWRIITKKQELPYIPFLFLALLIVFYFDDFFKNFL